MSPGARGEVPRHGGEGPGPVRPDTRPRPGRAPPAGRVADLRRAVESGGYEVRADLVAEAMLRAGLFRGTGPPARPD